MGYYDFEIECTVSRHAVRAKNDDSRTIFYSVAYLPMELVDQLPFKEYPRLRVDAEIQDVAIQGAWQPTGDGKYYFLLSKSLLKETGMKVDQAFEMRFSIADQDAVDVPPVLRKRIADLPALQKKWDELTPGKKRAFSIRVSQAKTAGTILKRVDEVVEMVSKGLSYGKGGRKQ